MNIKNKPQSAKASKPKKTKLQWVDEKTNNKKKLVSVINGVV
jgi:hypothetical protein